MQVVANDVYVVAKKAGTYKNSGEPYYKVTLTDGKTELFEVNCEASLWGGLAPMVTKYDLVINLTTSGYRTYSDLVEFHEV